MDPAVMDGAGFHEVGIAVLACISVTPPCPLRKKKQKTRMGIFCTTYTCKIESGLYVAWDLRTENQMFSHMPKQRMSCLSNSKGLKLCEAEIICLRR